MKKTPTRDELFKCPLKIVLLSFVFAGFMLTLGNTRVLADDPDNLMALQQQVISGVISDEIGSPMPGVNIQVEGTTIGTISDASGK
ncbi:MAG TPA: hypothetical protein PLA79_14530 [Bacteroidales bacterium]|nr:hypothetical protein [Bacteroidales bacterium]